MSGDVIIAEIEKNARDVLRVTLGQYRGYDIVGCRVWAQGDDGPVPTRAGFAIQPNKLDALIEALQMARAEGVAIGWLPDVPA